MLFFKVELLKYSEVFLCEFVWLCLVFICIFHNKNLLLFLVQLLKIMSLITILF